MQHEEDRRCHSVAVFDLDGTCIRGQSGTLFTVFLFTHGLMPARRFFALIWWGVRYKLHLPYRQSEARELVFSALQGLAPDTVDAIMADFHSRILEPRYRPDALWEIRRRKDEGMVVLCASATFEGIAKTAAQAHGFDGYVATNMQRDAKGYYTGEVKGAVVAGPEKYRAVAEWCDARLGAGNWSLECAYGDHYTDEDLLSHAKEAYAVCPGKTLRKLGKKHGWEILNWST